MIMYYECLSNNDQPKIIHHPVQNNSKQNQIYLTNSINVASYHSLMHCEYYKLWWGRGSQYYTRHSNDGDQESKI